MDFGVLRQKAAWLEETHVVVVFAIEILSHGMSGAGGVVILPDSLQKGGFTS